MVINLLLIIGRSVFKTVMLAMLCGSLLFTLYNCNQKKSATVHQNNKKVSDNPSENVRVPVKLDTIRIHTVTRLKEVLQTRLEKKLLLIDTLLSLDNESGQIDEDYGININNAQDLSIAGMNKKCGLTCSKPANIVNISYSNNICIADLMLSNGSGKPGDAIANGTHCIKINNCGRVTISNCDIEGMAYNGVAIGENIWNITSVKNCRISGCDIAIRSYSSFVDITGNTFVNTKTSDIALVESENPYTSQAFNISDNKFGNKKAVIETGTDNDTIIRQLPSSIIHTISVEPMNYKKFEKYESGSTNFEIASNPDNSDGENESEEESSNRGTYSLPVDEIAVEYDSVNEPVTLHIDWLDEADVVDSVFYSSEEDSFYWKLLRIGFISRGLHAGGALYKIIIPPYSQKGGIINIDGIMCIKKDDTLFLDSQSDLIESVLPPYTFTSDDHSSGGFTDLDDFTLFKGVSVIIKDPNINIPETAFEKEISIGDNTLNFYKSVVWYKYPDKNLIDTVAWTPDLHPVITIRNSSDDSSFVHPVYTETTDAASDADGCEDESCLGANAFYVFLPSHKLLIYSWESKNENNEYGVAEVKPAFFDSSEIDRKHTVSYVSWGTMSGWKTPNYFNCIVPPELLRDSALIPAGTLYESGDTIYGLKNAKNPLMRELYETVKSNMESNSGQQNEPVPAPQFFVKSHPWFFWRDPFGRLIRFIRYDYFPPQLAEPIIYAYSPEPADIAITIDKKVVISASNPLYENGWQIRTDTSGSIIERKSGKKYPYLFWEGRSRIMPYLQKGCIASRENIAPVLDSLLTGLGLVEHERHDFIKAWAGKLEKTPYTRMSFYAKELIDDAAPLYITPQPQTLIRILFEFEPLQNKRDIAPQTFGSLQKRDGLTIVEWGGFIR